MKLENGIRLSTKALCQHIGINYDSTLVLVQPLVPTEMPLQTNNENSDVVKNRHEYQLLNKALAAENLQKKLVLGEYLPQVALGGVGFVNDVMHTTNTNALAFVSVSVPISDWWGGSHKLKESQFKIEQANNKLTETTELLNLQIEQTRNEWNEARFQIKTSQASIDQSKENFKIVNDNYKAGVSSMSDLLEAQALYQNAQDQFSDAICMYKIKKANYLSAIGSYN